MNYAWSLLQYHTSAVCGHPHLESLSDGLDRILPSQLTWNTILIHCRFARRTIVSAEMTDLLASRSTLE